MKCLKCGFEPGEFVNVTGENWSKPLKGLGEFMECKHQLSDTEDSLCVVVQSLSGNGVYHGKRFYLPLQFVTRLRS